MLYYSYQLSTLLDFPGLRNKFEIICRFASVTCSLDPLASLPSPEGKIRLFSLSSNCTTAISSQASVICCLNLFKRDEFLQMSHCLLIANDIHQTSVFNHPPPHAPTHLHPHTYTHAPRHAYTHTHAPRHAHTHLPGQTRTHRHIVADILNG